MYVVELVRLRPVCVHDTIHLEIQWHTVIEGGIMFTDRIKLRMNSLSHPTALQLLFVLFGGGSLYVMQYSFPLALYTMSSHAYDTSGRVREDVRKYTHTCIPPYECISVHTVLRCFYSFSSRSQILQHTLVDSISHRPWHLAILHPVHQQLRNVSGAELVLIHIYGQVSAA